LSRDKEDFSRKQLEQTENLQKQLMMLQAEEESLKSIMVELRCQSRKLTLEKYRLLDLSNKKQEEERANQEQATQEQQSSSYNAELFMF
jgi:regulator of replication initiation timing